MPCSSNNGMFSGEVVVPMTCRPDASSGRASAWPSQPQPISSTVEARS